MNFNNINDSTSVIKMEIERGGSLVKTNDNIYAE